MNKYWFKAKERGWGISAPVSWEGWIALIVLILCILLEIFLTNANSLKGIIMVVFEIVITLGVFFFICKNRIKSNREKD